jgi:hypothetical protein
MQPDDLDNENFPLVFSIHELGPLDVLALLNQVDSAGPQNAEPDPPE